MIPTLQKTFRRELRFHLPFGRLLPTAENEATVLTQEHSLIGAFWA